MGWAIDGEQQRPFADSPEPQLQEEQGQDEQQPEASGNPVEDAGNQALDELSQGAVVQGDDARLRGIANKAAIDLASWPNRDPQAFRAWFERTVDGKFDIGPKGEFLVETSQGWMPFASIVRLGGLKRN